MNHPPRDEPFHDRILVFARFPEPGRTKTRLIPALGEARAAQLHEVLTARTLRTVRLFCLQSAAVEPQVYVANGTAELMQLRFGADMAYFLQLGETLGNRLQRAVSNAFADGCRRVFVVGTDSPDLNTEILNSARAAMDRHDVVLGPALDGGYYLIGLRGDWPELFDNVDWGTGSVLQQTLNHVRRLKLTVHLLDPLQDVDHPDDLLVCRRVSDEFRDVLPTVQPGLLSIIVPALNEERIMETTLSPLTHLPDVEIILADGGSTDATRDIAHKAGVRVVTGPAGRGRQQNAGAALSSGEVLLFLHADTQLPEGFPQHVWSVLQNGAMAGAFGLRIDANGLGLRLVEWGANFRSRLFQRPYGDQALFLRADTFFKLGGFPAWPLMEDYEFCRRLKRLGRIVTAPASVITSARRWRKLGVWKTWCMNQLCVLAFHLGVSPETLFRWYASHPDHRCRLIDFPQTKFRGAGCVDPCQTGTIISTTAQHSEAEGKVE